MTKFISCVFLCFFMIFFRKNIQLQVLQNLLKNFKWNSSSVWELLVTATGPELFD